MLHTHSYYYPTRIPCRGNKQYKLVLVKHSEEASWYHTAAQKAQFDFLPEKLSKKSRRQSIPCVKTKFMLLLSKR